MAVSTPVCDFGAPAIDFALSDTEGRIWQRDEITGPNGLLIMFICNHCPYVQAIMDRMVRDARALQKLGIGVAAICSNDSTEYPEDGLEGMQAEARKHGFTFPYLLDDTQAVAREYGAVCTPDFFGYDRDLGLQYRGRLDASGRNPAPEGAARELFDAMSAVAAGEPGPEKQIPSMGCSIKWKK